MVSRRRRKKELDSNENPIIRSGQRYNFIAPPTSFSVASHSSPVQVPIVRVSGPDLRGTEEQRLLQAAVDPAERPAFQEIAAQLDVDLPTLVRGLSPHAGEWQWRAVWPLSARRQRA